MKKTKALLGGRGQQCSYQNKCCMLVLKGWCCAPNAGRGGGGLLVGRSRAEAEKMGLNQRERSVLLLSLHFFFLKKR